MTVRGHDQAEYSCYLPKADADDQGVVRPTPPNPPPLIVLLSKSVQISRSCRTALSVCPRSRFAVCCTMGMLRDVDSSRGRHVFLFFFFLFYFLVLFLFFLSSGRCTMITRSRSMQCFRYGSSVLQWYSILVRPCRLRPNSPVPPPPLPGRK